MWLSKLSLFAKREHCNIKMVSNQFSNFQIGQFSNSLIVRKYNACHTVKTVSRVKVVLLVFEIGDIV